MSIDLGGVWGCRAHVVERIPDKPLPGLQKCSVAGPRTFCHGRFTGLPREDKEEV